jgi:hypothetical protein
MAAFPGQNPGEEIIIHRRRHWLMLLWRITPPPLVFLAALIAVVTLRIYLPTWQDVVLVGFFILFIPMSLYLCIWLLWKVYDWWNDEFILTNHRIIHIERVIHIEWQFIFSEEWREAQLSKSQNVVAKIFNLIANLFAFSEEQHEAQLSNIQNIAFTIPNLVAKLFNVGNLIVETADFEGKIEFDYIGDPKSVQKKILELRGLPRPAESPIRTAPFYRHVLPFAPIYEDKTIIWRKHWFILLKAITIPLLAVVLLVVLLAWIGTSPQILTLGRYAVPVQAVLVFLLIVFSLVSLWQYVDWWNDIYILTEDRIIDIRRIPLLYEDRREAYLEQIQDVRFTIPNLLYRILGLGDVFIETAGKAENFPFDTVPNPAQVAKELVDHLDHLWAVRVEPARLDLLRLETLQEICAVQQRLAWLPANRMVLPGDAPEALRRLEAVGTEVEAAVAPVSRRIRGEHLAAAHKGLDDFQRFAAVGRGTQAFIEVAEHWRGILERQAALLKAIPNPFVAGPSLTAGSPLFVGREDILKEIADHLAAGRGTVAEALPKPALVLYGQRRMGKSSILLQLPVRLPTDYIPAYADLRGLAAQGTAGLLRGLARVAAEAVAGRGLTPPIVAPLEDFSSEPFALFNTFLDEVEAVIGTRRVALLLDEFEWLQEKVDEVMVSRDIFGYLASVIKLRPQIFLVFAGLHSLEQMRREYWTAFLYGNSVGIPVSYLAETEGERLLAMLPVETSPEVRERICQNTGCQPYLLQVVCYRLVEYLNAREPSPEQASVGDVATVLDLILEKGEADYYFEDYVWRNSTPAEQEALVTLAQPGKQVGLLLQEEALRSLERREILIQRRDGTWRYRVELVRRWVARKAREVTTTEV